MVYSEWDLSCNHLGADSNVDKPGGHVSIVPELQTPSPPTESRNPETPKVQFKARKMPFLTPRKNDPNSQEQMPLKSIFGRFNSPKMDFLGILIDFGEHFSGGSKMAFFEL